MPGQLRSIDKRKISIVNPLYLRQCSSTEQMVNFSPRIFVLNDIALHLVSSTYLVLASNKTTVSLLAANFLSLSLHLPTKVTISHASS